MNLAFNLAFYGSLLAFIVAMAAFTVSSRIFRILQEVFLACVFLEVTIYISLRWYAAARPPFSDLFESLICFSWALLLAYAVIRKSTGLWQLAVVAALTTMGILGYAWLSGGGAIQPLLPALQNNLWLTTHVILCFIGYAGFTLSVALAALCLAGLPDAPQSTARWHHRGALFFIVSLVLASATVVWFRLPPSDAFVSRLSFAAVPAAFLTLAVGLVFARLRLKAFATGRRSELDQACYGAVAFGFPFLGAGIASGSVWANVAWGSYWSWDPKETSSLVTWLVFAAYLHARGWSGERAPWVYWLPLVGFACLLFTYFGVNYLESLHSYGAN